MTERQVYNRNIAFEEITSELKAMLFFDPGMEVVTVDIKYKVNSNKTPYYQPIFLNDFTNFSLLRSKLNNVFDQVKSISKIDKSINSIRLKIHKGLVAPESIGRIINIDLTGNYK